MDNMQTTRQLEVLHNIASDIGDVEKGIYGLKGDQGYWNRTLSDRLRKIRLNVEAEINSNLVAADILDGYRSDAIDGVLGFKTMLKMTLRAAGGGEGISDTELQLLAVCASSFVGRIEKYLKLKDDVMRGAGEVDNG